MPHQCVRCGKIYDDGSEEILKGCPCGSHFFFFMRENSLKRVKEQTEKLTQKEREEIESDVKSIIGKEIDETKPIILDLESIRIKKPGKFELDLVKLFKGAPLVYKVEDGKYIIDIATTFQMQKEEKE